MTDALQAALAAAGVTSDPFPPTSRYHAVGTATRQTEDGRTVTYLRRRLVPPPDRFATLQEHTVREGDRLDRIAAQYLGDPEQSWRICDANAAMRPDDLVARPGQRLRITLAEGLPGAAGG